MFKALAAAIVGLGLIAFSGASRADDGGLITMRLIGDAPTFGEGLPQHFVLNIQVNEADSDGRREVTGHFTALTPEALPGWVEGACVRGRCELSVELSVPQYTARFKLTADLGGPAGLKNGLFQTDAAAEQRPGAKGSVSFSPIPNAIADLGERVRPDALDSLAFEDLMLWDGPSTSFGGEAGQPIDESQLESLASWQLLNHRPITGLLFTSDLELLISQRGEAQKAVGWTKLGEPGQGWSAGYPASLLTQASRTGAERRFSSPDGKASLVIAIDPPLSDDDFSALVEKLINGGPNRSDQNYVRSGPNMEISYVEAGHAVSAVYFNRRGGLARLVYTYPSGDNPFADQGSYISHSLRVTDDLKPAP